MEVIEMSAYKDKLMEDDLRTWGMVEDAMKDSEFLEEAKEKVDRLMIQGVITLPLDCDNWKEFEEAMSELWYEINTRHF